jgi:L-ascorbate metabolism protein UlaG (beta-lactamase superfamily)
MNLPFTMPPEEAAECVKAFRPKIVYPYHYRNSDLSVFVNALKGESGIEVRVRNWY